MSENKNSANNPSKQESYVPEGEQLTLAKRVHLIGAVSAFGSALFYFVIYLQTDAWQTLANSIGVALAMFSIGAGYIALQREKFNLTQIFGLAAVILAYGPGELFWDAATLYNLTAGVILLILVKLVLSINNRKYAIATTVFLIIVLYSNLVEPFTRYDINLSPALRVYIPSIAILLSVAIGWQFTRSFRIGSIRTRMVIAFLGVTIVPLILLTVVNNRFIQNTLIESANQALFNVASDSASNVDKFISTNLPVVSSEAQLQLFSDYLSLPISQQQLDEFKDPIQKTLATLHQKDFRRIFSYGLLDENGINVADSIPANIGIDESRFDYFQFPINENQAFASDVVFRDDAVSYTASIYFSAPVVDSDGEIVGILRIQYHASVIQDIVRASNDIAGEESFGILFQEVDGRHLYIANGIDQDTLFTTMISYDDPAVLLALQEASRLPRNLIVQPSNLQNLHHNIMMVDQETLFTATDVEAGNRLNQVAILRLTEKGNWIIAFFQPQDVFLSGVQQQNTISVVLMLVTSALVTSIALILSQILSRPITRLTEVAQKVASGDLSAVAPVESDDEIGILATTFNSMTKQLDDVITNLEGTISERTQTLEKRATYLEAAAEVGRTASEVSDMDEMLETVSNLIAERFGFYHVGILLLDSTREYAVLRAANSEGGWRMIARGHKLKVGEQGIIGSVTSTGEAKIEQSVSGEGAVHFANPELPYTRSEMGLPLISGNEILGALDVQSSEEQAFTQEDISVLQVLADQVAMAINNRLLLIKVEESLEAERRLYGEISSQAWAERLKLAPISGFISSQHGLSEISGDLSPDNMQAVNTGQTVVQNKNGDGDENHYISIPVKIHGDQVLAVIETYKPASDGEWTAEEIEILESITEQLGASLENARLFEETQRQAERERVSTEVSSQLWSSSDIDSILQTAVKELGKALNVSSGTIRLKVDERNISENNNDGI